MLRERCCAPMRNGSGRRTADQVALFGIDVVRSSRQLCRASLSAQEIAQPLLDERIFNGKQEQMESDFWIWICLTALWQRWVSGPALFRNTDDKIQLGYEVRPSEAKVASRVWLEAWDDVLRIFDRSGMQSIREFELRFEGTAVSLQLIQDLEDELLRAGRWDWRLLKARIAVCKEALRRFRDDDRLPRRTVLTHWRESLFEPGETEQEAEGLYCEWLNQNPAGDVVDRMVGLLPFYTPSSGIGPGASNFARMTCRCCRSRKSHRHPGSPGGSLQRAGANCGSR